MNNKLEDFHDSSPTCAQERLCKNYLKQRKKARQFRTINFTHDSESQRILSVNINMIK